MAALVENNKLIDMVVNPTVANMKRGKIEYADFGSGPLVIAIHGAMGGYDQSALLAKTIGADNHRYIAVSRPGYLGTPMKSGISPEAQADLYADLLDHLGEQNAIVMAVSGGGPSAIHFAVRHKERCRRLILASTCGVKSTTRIPKSFSMMRWMTKSRAFCEMIARKALADIDATASRSIPNAELRKRTLADEEIGPLFHELIVSTSNRMGERMDGTCNDIRITQSSEYPLESIKAPTLIIHGNHDRLVPYDPHAKALVSRIPGAEILTIDGGDHVSIFTHRALVLPKVAEFMRSV